MSGKNPTSDLYVFSAAVDDVGGSGIAITVTTAGTPLPLKGAGFAQVVNNTDGGLVWAAADGTLTVAKAQAAGTYEIEAVPGNTIGNNSGVKIVRLAKNGTLIGNQSRAVEPSTAVQSGMAPAKALVSLALGDVIEIDVDVGTNGHAVTFRSLLLCAKKLAG